MKIKYNKNGLHVVSFENFFKDVSELVKFIKEKNQFINPENIIEKVNQVYSSLQNSNEEIKSSIIDWRIIQEFGFKFKRPVRLEFWEERGFGLKEFNEYCQKTGVGNNQFKAKTNNKELQTFDKENEFEYGNFSFKTIGKPICNLCKSELIISPSIGRYIINSCDNKNCESNKNKDIWSIRQLAFMPLNFFKNKNERINLNSKINKEYWLLKGFSYEKYLEEISLIKEKTKEINQRSKEYYEIIYDMSIEEAEFKFKSESILNINFWLNKGLSEIEAKEKISELQKFNSLKFSEKRKKNPGAYSAITQNQLAYWINNGCSEDEAKNKLKKRQQTFSLEKCIEKYGYEEGIIIFTERQNKWQKSLNEGGNLKMGYSKISQDLFWEILNNYKVNEKSEVHFATKNEEFRVQKKEGGIYMYDFADLKRKKIIEYNGDMYHGNPKKYLAEDYPHPFRKDITANEMWNKDEKKRKLAEKEGFDAMVIWDSEYRWGNKQAVIKKCLDFLGIKK